MKKLWILSVLFILFTSCGSAINKQSTFFVRGNCEMCKERIESTASSIKGVSFVAYDVDKEELKVGYDTLLVSEIEIEKKIAQTGHATLNVPMDTINHNKLPECCKVHASGEMMEHSH
jgi:Cu(I)/Ag(I) efflux system membrane fusion protein